MRVRMLALFALCCILCSAAGAQAANTTTAALNSASGVPGEAVELTVNISGNPGVAAWMFELAWDAEALSLDTVDGVARAGEAFASGTFLARQKNESSMTVSWYNIRNVSSDGKLFSIRLQPSASANGVYPVTLSCVTENTINIAEKEVTIACVSGSVKVTGTQHNDASGGASSSGSAASTEIVEAAQEPAQTKTEFVDVLKTAFYYDAVQWAVAGGITNGVGGDHFEPDGVCSRAQAVTFLWRAAGSPEPVVLSNPFSDVVTGSYYYKAVLWAVAEGITNGTGTDTFSPDATVDRAQTVTFLWRANGSEHSKGTSPFHDLAAGAYYADAVQWAVENHITGGTGTNTFSPGAFCTRAQIVTFLFRDKTGGESK